MGLIIGIDPGLNKTGWGIVERHGSRITFVDSGIIVTDAKLPLARRLKIISQRLDFIIKKYDPGEAAIEETFVNKNPLSSLKLGHARGAIIATIAIADIEVFEYAARLIKKSVVGVGNADKNQVMQMIKILLPRSDIAKEDEADALAVAITHINHKG